MLSSFALAPNSYLLQIISPTERKRAQDEERAGVTTRWDCHHQRTHPGHRALQEARERKKKSVGGVRFGTFLLKISSLA